MNKAAVFLPNFNLQGIVLGILKGEPVFKCCIYCVFVEWLPFYCVHFLNVHLHWIKRNISFRTIIAHIYLRNTHLHVYCCTSLPLTVFHDKWNSFVWLWKALVYMTPSLPYVRRERCLTIIYVSGSDKKSALLTSVRPKVFSLSCLCMEQIPLWLWGLTVP